MSDTRRVVDEILAYWCAQDVESAVSLMAQDIVYTINVSELVLPYGGQTIGRDALRDAMYAMHRDWTYLVTEPTYVVTSGDTGKAHINFRYHHNKSGDALAGTFRFVFQVKDGLVTRIDEYQDKRLFEAFLRIAGGT